MTILELPEDLAKVLIEALNARRPMGFETVSINLSEVDWALLQSSTLMKECMCCEKTLSHDEVVTTSTVVDDVIEVIHCCIECHKSMSNK